MGTRVLFHGTSAKFKTPVMRHGLRPRNLTGKSTYEGDLVSAEDRVYLSDVYALAFANLAIAKHGGNIMIAAAKVDDSLILPDTDFTEEGKHRRKFTDGLECLDKTGCVSVVGTVPVFRLWIIGKKHVEEIREKVTLRIETGIRHKGFYQQYQDLLEYYLSEGQRWDWDGEGWRNEFGQYAKI